jgi:hypothetical protein
MNKVLICFVAALAILKAAAASEWQIHEWGTFTSLQDETGRTIGGINTDDEPVPRFVHRLAHWVLQTPSEVPVIFFQGAPRCHPDVTMRLETPVIYFHPPTGVSDHKATVTVKFRGGWLTEFYPLAHPELDGLAGGKFNFGKLDSNSESALSWNDLSIGGDWPLTNTTEHVWTSPRAVDAALVRTTTGEAEKFLFYRGVGHLDAPMQVSRSDGEFVFRSQLRGFDGRLRVESSWLVDIRKGGKVAFRRLPPMTLKKDAKVVVARTDANFTEKEYSVPNLEKLKGSLRKTLIAEGLFADEAEALLNTWELSYFKSQGLRVFFTVPSEWTDFVLPLEISLPAKVSRAMVGRIELVTPEQRDKLRQIASYSPSRIDREMKIVGERYFQSATGSRSPNHTASADFNSVSQGRQPLSALIAVPETYRTYLELGRFRNALILEEAERNPSPGLAHFIKTYRLEGSRIDRQGR